MNDKNPQQKSNLIVSYKVSYAFWVPVYVKMLGLFCVTFGLEPDANKVRKTIRRGTKLVPISKEKY